MPWSWSTLPPLMPIAPTISSSRTSGVPPRKDRDATAGGIGEAEEVLTRLGETRQDLRGNPERGRREGLVRRDVQRPEACAIEPGLGADMSAGVRDGDRDGAPKLERLRLGCRRDASRFVERQL